MRISAQRALVGAETAIEVGTAAGLTFRSESRIEGKGETQFRCTSRGAFFGMPVGWCSVLGSLQAQLKETMSPRDCKVIKVRKER